MKANSGSPPPGEPEYLLVGTLRRPHGLHGELLMEVVTDFPERLKPAIDGLPRRTAHAADGDRRRAEGMLAGC